MPRVYISGPITGVENYNTKAFCDAESHLLRAGFSVVNPLRINGVIDCMNEIIITREEHSSHPREYYLKKDIARLVECDYIFFLKGWENSKGALFERSVANELKISELFKSENNGIVTFYR